MIGAVTIAVLLSLGMRITTTFPGGRKSSGTKNTIENKSEEL